MELNEQTHKMWRHVIILYYTPLDFMSFLPGTVLYLVLTINLTIVKVYWTSL